MGALGISQASDLANALLDYYVKDSPLLQTMQERPLLACLMATKKPFPAGKGKISSAVKGTVMSDTDGFGAGYSEDDALTFMQSDNILRAEYSWYEMNAGLKISGTELKKDGIILTNDQKMKQNAGADTVRIAGSLFKDRIEDFVESWARYLNDTLWADGSQDAKAIPGLLSILTDTPAVGTTGGLNRATYAWWQHRARLGALGVTANTGPKVQASADNQTLTKMLRSELRQLRRYGGRPNKALCGSAFIEGLELEVFEKGLYTQEGFINKGKNDLGMADISLRGLGTFEYDPTLDDLGYTKRCYIWDTRMLRLRPMEGGENVLLEPERPYNYLAYFRSMTYTGGLEARQLNCNGVYEIA